MEPQSPSSAAALPTPSPPPAVGGWRGYVRPTTIGFWGVHVAALAGVLALGISWSGVLMAAIAYFARMIVVTLAYHRYFSHRAFKTSRWFQFILALGAQSAGQKGVLWWASHHRWHHKHSDTQQDVHSAKLRGFWYSHLGWIIRDDWSETDERGVADLMRFPELRFLNRGSIAMLPTVALALAFLLLGGVHALVWGYFVSTVLLWHGSFSINSLCHVFGRQRYATNDGSRNNLFLALLTTGEGWHNNHHHYMSSANQGFRWWQVDLTYYVLQVLQRLGLVWDLRKPPRHVVEAPRPLPARAAPDAGATTVKAA